jgi:hypothetical protein
MGGASQLQLIEAFMEGHFLRKNFHIYLADYLSENRWEEVL